MVIKRRDLRPEMKVKHKRTGNIARLRVNPQDKSKIRLTHPDYVAVVRKIKPKKGKRKHIHIYSHWLLKNVEIVSQ